MTRHSAAQQIKEAYQIARDHGMFVVQKDGVYIVYRKTTERPVRLGRRATPEGLRRFVADTAGFH